MTPSKTSTTSSARSEPALPFPSLFAASCHWADPWLVAAGTRTGSRHTGAGQPTDDAMSVTRCGPHVLLAIADGAGDALATRSSEGAQRAVATAAAAAHRAWSAYGCDTQLLVEALAAARIDLVGRAHAEGLDPAAYATTLMLVLLAGNRILAARVGDGSLYTWDGRALSRFCAAPLPSTATPMLVQEDWRTWLAVADIERDFIQGVALCSDGADEFFLEASASRDARVPSAATLARASEFADAYGPTGPFGHTVQMLNDPVWARLTSDDRTVIMAIKPQTHKARPQG